MLCMADNDFDSFDTDDRFVPSRDNCALRLNKESDAVCSCN